MDFDVVVIGAGAAGMMCASETGRRGRRVLLIDHATRLAERIRISGGGHCNFTNRHASAENYLSKNPHFCRSALARFPPRAFIAMVERRGIPYHERDHGQLFCEGSARDIIDMLKCGCDDSGASWATTCVVHRIERIEPHGTRSHPRFAVSTSHGRFECRSLVVATGGLAAPQLGASPFGYHVAEQFGLRVVPPRPALVPLALAPGALDRLKPLAGATIDGATRCPSRPGVQFRENVLVTHRGLSGPAILQISSYWQMQEQAGGGKQPIEIDLLPDIDTARWLAENRGRRVLLPNLLAERLPRRFAHEWCALLGWQKPVGALSRRELDELARTLKGWTLMPSGTLGYAHAEVTLGGVDTVNLSSTTMEARSVPGLYFVGEVVDVAGWLGGYNFQWAWSSGWAAGQDA
jgi:predicted Rossmann fold flavoprotein